MSIEKEIDETYTEVIQRKHSLTIDDKRGETGDDILRVACQSVFSEFPAMVNNMN